MSPESPRCAALDPAAAGEPRHVRSITSRSGHELTLHESRGSEAITLKTRGGHQVMLDDAAGGTITIAHSGGAIVEIAASGTVTIRALAEVEIRAPAGLKVTAAQVRIDAPLAKFSGVVQADTVVTNTVVAAAYTPGAGNVW